jgi:cell wall-associated NlpC family hydrolase
MQAGDLIFYRKNGVVNHVAMYIGNGKVIGAASRKEGIKIKKYNYRTPYRVVSYINR